MLLPPQSITEQADLPQYVVGIGMASEPLIEETHNQPYSVSKQHSA
jgi:hypothetical protein